MKPLDLALLVPASTTLVLAEIHRKYIFAGHVNAYMKTLIEDELEKYQTHFSLYIKKGIEADGIEELYKKVHAAIHAYRSIMKNVKCTEDVYCLSIRYNLKKLTYDERRTKLIARLEALNSAVDEDEDDE
ncbi:large ribosomal subunit protein uL18-like [Vicia villosa]|uniref:large ribosomal subunit protein uL18-like n=1 Tax=Vicia villosa TaxID=3911 RepID=UPI00273BC848|nr:large ribosomal subunit protein uL18-like [Vicia villosa]